MPGPRVLVAVCGGIAAYKAAEIVRALQRHGADVQVLMTRAACDFVGPATFAALTGRGVVLDVDGPAADGSYPHLDVARDVDVMVVAPATAATISRMAHGLAEDVLAATYVGCDAPVLVAPAMNVRMWQHPATRRNLDRLRLDGVHVVEPTEGRLACGDVGPGRLAPPEQVAAAAMQLAGSAPRPGQRDLDGIRMLVTAGGTSEPIDCVRTITNRSSGRMGLAIAAAAQARGAQVELVVTRTVSEELIEAHGVRPSAVVDRAGELAEEVFARASRSDVVVMVAAVSDFTVSEADGKLARNGRLVLELEPTEDIIARVVHERGETSTPLVVGFAAETGAGGLQRAREKRLRKGLDVIVHNDVERSDIGFGSTANEVTIVDRLGEQHAGPASKREVADAVLDRVALLGARLDVAGAVLR